MARSKRSSKTPPENQKGPRRPATSSRSVCGWFVCRTADYLDGYIDRDSLSIGPYQLSSVAKTGVFLGRVSNDCDGGVPVISGPVPSCNPFYFLLMARSILFETLDISLVYVKYKMRDIVKAKTMFGGYPIVVPHSYEIRMDLSKTVPIYRDRQVHVLPKLDKSNVQMITRYEMGMMDSYVFYQRYPSA